MKTLLMYSLICTILLGCNVQQKSLNGYFERLDDIFKIIKKCEKENLLVDNLLESEEAHTTFKRLN